LSRTFRDSAVSAAALALGAVVILAVAALRPHAAPPPIVVPAVHSNITMTADGQMVFRSSAGATYTMRDRAATWTLDQLRGHPKGTDHGIALDFGKADFAGTLVFGLVPYDDTRYPQPVFRTTTPIKAGKADIDITRTLAGTYDMVGWAKRGGAVIGYRVMMPDGSMIYDGRVRFKGTGPFEVDVALAEGPFVANVTDTSAVVWFEIDRPAACSVTVGPKTVACAEGATHQELQIAGLAPATAYQYVVHYAGYEEHYGFRTAPRPGARQPFTFGYASDSRGAPGGGDRNFFGPNAYMVRRIMALALSRSAAFLQFTGDLGNGNVTSPDAVLTEIGNWKRAAEPYEHWLPVYTGVGNHEAVVRDFVDPNNRSIRTDRFPYETDSTEATFARALVNPVNGPASEDGAVYDPNPAAVDFPSYRENVYWYAYDNVAMIVLNSDYWYAPTLTSNSEPGGNLHGYLMDNQIAWVGKTLDALERNPAIDHVFLTVHTPVFPNGGHVSGGMWYSGNNTPRPVVAGKPVAKGIIERRDDLLRLIQAHPKVLAIFTGDEHNYNRLQLGPGVEIYPAKWDLPKVVLKRTFYQINNGAAGAPYYAQEQTPWSPFVKGFSTQNALCLLRVAGRRVELEVVNPETLEVLDKVVLR
jgi:hypothetical protein